MNTASKASISEYYAAKLLYVSDWQDPKTSDYAHERKLSLIDGCYVGKDVVQAHQKYLYSADISILISTKAAYTQDLTILIRDLAVHNGYSPKCIEALVTVAHELIMNAVIHGNMGLDIDLSFAAENHSDNVQKTFSQIEEKLSITEFADKPILISINFFGHKIAFNIKDEGAGFDFVNFKNKYDETGLHKGMDLVFIMSSDFDYDETDNITSVIIEDKGALEINEKLFEDEVEKTFAILSNKQSHYLLLKNVLNNFGYKNTICIGENDENILDILKDTDLLICLANIDEQKLVKILNNIRAVRAFNYYPVLCQKSPHMSRFVFKDISKLEVEFLSETLVANEILARTKSQLAMTRVQKRLYDFYAHIKLEVEQARKTIDYFEKHVAVDLYNRSDEICGYVKILGSYTVSNSRENLFELTQQNLPYGQGIYFQLAGIDFFVFLSLERGLVPTLILSTLKGFVEHLNVACDELHSAGVMHKINRHLNYILPASFKCSVFCAMWDSDNHYFECASIGGFSLYEMSQSSKNIVKLDFDGEAMVLREGHNFLVVDEKIEANFKTLFNIFLEDDNFYEADIPILGIKL